jgi:glycosyltransferase involved in cell wall biosynthesis
MNHKPNLPHEDKKLSPRDANSDLHTPMTAYRVLAVTNMWPHEADPSYGIFVKEQMDSLRPLGVEYDVVFVNGRESRWNYLRGIWQVRRRLREKQYDLIHAHFGLAGWVARFQLRVPLVIDFLGDDVLGRPRRDGRITPMGRFFQITSYLLARLASAVIVQSEEMQQLLKWDAAKILPCGVDMELFRPMDQAEARRLAGLDPGKKYVLFVYNPAEQRKRYDLVEAAVAKAKEQVPEVEILHLRGKPHSQIALYMNAADVLVMASMLEGSPNAVKEAMATNLPVITVKVGDAVRLIGPTEGCHLVPRDASAIAEKIVAVCRRGGRTNGREWIRQLSMEVVAQQHIELYAATLRRSKGGNAY